MSIPNVRGTCDYCGEAGVPLEKRGTQKLCKRCRQWQEDLQASAGTQKAVEKFQKLFRG